MISFRRTAVLSLLLVGCSGAGQSAEDERTGSTQQASTQIFGDFAIPDGMGDGTTAAYSNGPVPSNVRIVSVFWGPNVAQTITSQIGGFYSTLVDSTYLDWMSEYNTPTQHIGRGTFAGNFTITPGFTGTTVADSNVTTEIANQINAGHLPVPDANSLYMVQFPPGYTITAPDGSPSCGYCGYHTTATKVIQNKSTKFYYAIMPDFSNGC